MNKLDKYLILHISTFVFNKFYSSNSQALQIALVDKYLNKCLSQVRETLRPKCHFKLDIKTKCYKTTYKSHRCNIHRHVCNYLPKKCDSLLYSYKYCFQHYNDKQNNKRRFNYNFSSEYFTKLLKYTELYFKNIRDGKDCGFKITDNHDKDVLTSFQGDIYYDYIDNNRMLFKFR